MAQPNSGIMPDAIRLLRLPAVLARTGLSRSCLYKPAFPR
jgi:predicted DNA-binding transcriptional regulator AlpA